MYGTPNALFYADEDLAFAVTYGCGWQNVEHLAYSEVDWLEPELVRLLGSLMLAEDPEQGIRCRFYPVPYGGFDIAADRLDLTSTRTAKQILSALVETIDDVKWPAYTRSLWETCIGQTISLTDYPASYRRLHRRYHAGSCIDNFVLMRGFQALIKSDMLSQYPEFQEEAAIATFIALDASFELVTRHLEQIGISKPTSRDAGDWLFRTFDEPLGLYGAEGLKYFEEFYDQRIQTMHPGSRFGDAPFAPIMVDDRIHLRETLPQVFAYLIVGEHAPHYMKRLHVAKALAEL